MPAAAVIPDQQKVQLLKLPYMILFDLLVSAGMLLVRSYVAEQIWRLYLPWQVPPYKAIVGALALVQVGLVIPILRSMQEWSGREKRGFSSTMVGLVVYLLFWGFAVVLAKLMP